MSAESFLSSFCELWGRRNQQGHLDIVRLSWRDWMIETLLSSYLNARNNGNHGDGWHHRLHSDLRRHATSFPEVLISAFGVDRDVSPRTLLQPTDRQSKALAVFRDVLNGAKEVVGFGAWTHAVTVSDEQHKAALEIVRLVTTLWPHRQPRNTTSIKVSVDMQTIANARLCVAAHIEASRGECTLFGHEWSRCRNYLDAVILQWHPTAGISEAQRHW